MCNCKSNFVGNINSTAKTIIRGVVGVTKALTHIDDVDFELMMKRRNICKGCEFKEFNALTRSYHCTVCKCCLKLKTQVNSESCPLKKW